jgi:hypothetical protein
MEEQNLMWLDCTKNYLNWWISRDRGKKRFQE